MRLICSLLVGAIFIAFSCNKPKNPSLSASDNNHALPPLAPGTKNQPVNIATGKTTPSELITFARSLKGTPYKYSSTDPQQGFDCSGFVTCVFNHFGIRVPRPSVDFAFVNREIDIKNAKPGDLILFTGTDSTTRTVGHMGIVVSNHMGDVIFIHATSRDNKGVTETPLDPYYRQRYIKTIRVFPQNDQ
ncbi:MAG TPA: C40 family peptidase [Mucilaginibacter sp.]|jgi:cell wall-associated NlpC family hydrolase